MEIYGLRVKLLLINVVKSSHAIIAIIRIGREMLPGFLLVV